MDAADGLVIGEIGKRPGELQHAMKAARAEPHAFGGLVEQGRLGPSRRATSSITLAGAMALVEIPGRPSAA